MQKPKIILITLIFLSGIFGWAGMSWAVESICPGGSNPDPNVIFCDDFEGGDLSKWTYAVPRAEIVSIPSPVYSGNNSLHIPYDIPAGPPEHQDNNRFVQVDMSSYNLDHFFVRGYFYLAYTDKPTAARKLYYIWCNPQTDPKWDIVVSANGGISSTPLSLSFCSNYYPSYSDLSWPQWDIAKGKIFYDTWYLIEVEVKLNSVPGIKDGEVRLWLNDNLEYEKTSISIRNDSKNLGIVRIGAQIDRDGDELERHEDRYWDDIAISKRYIDPLSESNATPPSAPTGVQVE